MEQHETCSVCNVQVAAAHKLRDAELEVERVGWPFGNPKSQPQTISGHVDIHGLAVADQLATQKLYATFASLHNGNYRYATLYLMNSTGPNQKKKDYVYDPGVAKAIKKMQKHVLNADIEDFAKQFVNFSVNFAGVAPVSIKTAVQSTTIFGLDTAERVDIGYEYERGAATSILELLYESTVGSSAQVASDPGVLIIADISFIRNVVHTLIASSRYHVIPDTGEVAYKDETPYTNYLTNFNVPFGEIIGVKVYWGPVDVTTRSLGFVPVFDREAIKNNDHIFRYPQ